MKNKALKLMNQKNTVLSTALKCGLTLTRQVSFDHHHHEVEQALMQLGTHGTKGFASASYVEAPGRYCKYELVMTKTAVELTACGLDFKITAHSQIGKVMMDQIYETLNVHPNFQLDRYEATDNLLSGRINKCKCNAMEQPTAFAEEDRTKQISIFTLLREIREILSPAGFQEAPAVSQEGDDYFGFYGLYGYELVFQFETLKRVANSSKNENDLHLFLPETLLVYEPLSDSTAMIQYGLADQINIEGTPNAPSPHDAPHEAPYDSPQAPTTSGFEVNRPECHPMKNTPIDPPVDFKVYVQAAKEKFFTGDLFEVVPSYEMVLQQNPTASPFHHFQALIDINPSPYCFMVGTGTEHVIGASPEMYLRSDGSSIETCPISGTIVRGKGAIEDESQIRQLLCSKKDAFELTMCTDVDRNDKSRVCEPGSIKIKGRRMVEVYSHLIHTVDWVTGRLRADCDAMDAFISHMWAVTVTGAPKTDAIQWIEDHEATRRAWYGGAVGFFGFDGSIDTGLTIRTLRCSPLQSTTRVGATLLHHSDALEEEKETQIKSEAMVQASKRAGQFYEKSFADKQLISFKPNSIKGTMTSKSPKVLMVDHRDSFVHTLADYFRQCGAQLTTLRYDEAQVHLSRSTDYDLVVLSPGPGTPSDFNLSHTLDLCLAADIPVFGVCLGLQGLVAYFGGKLAQLSTPLHGEPSLIEVLRPSRVFNGLPDAFSVGRYHSLYASELPACLTLTAVDAFGIPMAIEHKTLNIHAVQFHPESLMTDSDIGLGIIHNILKLTTQQNERRLTS